MLFTDKYIRLGTLVVFHTTIFTSHSCSQPSLAVPTPSFGTWRSSKSSAAMLFADSSIQPGALIHFPPCFMITDVGVHLKLLFTSVMTRCSGTALWLLPFFK
jgi:hypothetical protein